MSGDLGIVKLVARLDHGLIASDSRSAGEKAGEEFSEAFKENVRSLAMGLVGVETIKEAYKEVISGTVALQEAQGRARVAAESAGLAWSGVKESMDGAVEAGAKLNFGAGEITDAYGTLLTRTHDLGKAHQEMAFAMDYARYKHVDLSTAANAANQAYLGYGRALEDLGIQLGANSTAYERAAAFQLAASRVAGQAREATTGLSGEVGRLKTGFSEMAEEAGGHVVPLLTSLVSTIADHKKGFLELVGGIGSAIGAYKVYGIAAEGVIALQQKLSKETTAAAIGEANTALARAQNAHAAAVAAQEEAATVAAARTEEAAAAARVTGANVEGTAAARALTAALAEQAAAARELVIANGELAISTRGVSAAEETAAAASGGFMASRGGGLLRGAALLAPPVAGYYGLNAVLGSTFDPGAEGWAKALDAAKVQSVPNDRSTEIRRQLLGANPLGAIFAAIHPGSSPTELQPGGKYADTLRTAISAMPGGNAMGTAGRFFNWATQWLPNSNKDQADKALSSIDEALVTKFNSGDHEGAARAFDVVAQAAERQGRSLDSVKAKLPEYTKALEGVESPADKAARAILNVRDAADAAVSNLKGLNAYGQAARAVLEGFWAANADVQESLIRANSSVAASSYDLFTRLRDADRAVRDAGWSASDQVVNANKAMEASTYSLGAAHREERMAERDLIDTRWQTIDQLRQMNNAARDAPLNAQEARINLQEANLRALQTAGLPETNVDRERAVLGQQRARNALDDALANGTEAQRQAAVANERGIEGSSAMIGARQRVSDAQRSETLAADNVTRTRVQSARDATRAHEALADAQHNASRSLNENTAEGARNVGSILSQVDAAKQKYAIDLELAGKDEGLRQKARDSFDATLKKIGDEAAGYGMDRQKVDELIQTVTDARNLGPVDLMINLLGDEDAKTKINDFFSNIQTWMQLLTGASAVLNPPHLPTVGGVKGPWSASYAASQPHLPTVGGVTGPWSASFAATRQAEGGPVPYGPHGRPGVDSVPALLVPDEHVWTTQEVRAAGGHGNVKALRNAVLGRYAAGGPVAPTASLGLGLNYDLGKLTDALLPVMQAQFNAAVASRPAAADAGGAYTGPAGNSINEILAVANRSGVPHTVTAESFDTPGYFHSDNGGYHSKHEAVDFGNYQYGQLANDRFAAWWATNYGSRLLELIHTRGDGKSGWYIKNGRPVSGPGFYGPDTVASHVNHVHVAAAPGFSSGALPSGIAGAGSASAPAGGLWGEVLSLVAGQGAASAAAAPSSGNIDVAAAAYATARAMGADHKVLLALFEAGLVESGMRNLSYGDRDSLGFLQQRPSQGWPSPMNVPVATRSFVGRAMANEAKYGTSGQLAQSVQRSAFPSRYDQRATAAEALLKTVSHGLYDDGGWLWPDTVPHNQLTKPEAVLTPDESAGLKAAVAGGPVELGDDSIRRLVVGIVQAIQARPYVAQFDGRQAAEVVTPHIAAHLASPGLGWSS